MGRTVDRYSRHQIASFWLSMLDSLLYFCFDTFYPIFLDYYCDDVDISPLFPPPPIERFVSRGLTSSNVCVRFQFRLVMYRLNCIYIVETFFFFSFLIHPFSKWNRHVVICLFVFFCVFFDRLWWRIERRAKLNSEPKRVSIVKRRKTTSLTLLPFPAPESHPKSESSLSFFLLCYVCSNSATTTREPLKNGWENKMRVNQPFVSRQIWNSSWESWKIYLSALFLIKYKGTIYRLGYCGAAVELIKCSR